MSLTPLFSSLQAIWELYLQWYVNIKVGKKLLQTFFVHSGRRLWWFDHPDLYCPLKVHLVYLILSLTKETINLEIYNTFFFFATRTQHLRPQKQQHLSPRKAIVMTIAASKQRVSRLWYWIQLRLWAAGRRWSAPWCLTTNSVQNTARSRGFTAWSWCTDMRFTIFSL